MKNEMLQRLPAHRIRRLTEKVCHPEHRYSPDRLREGSIHEMIILK